MSARPWCGQQAMAVFRSVMKRVTAVRSLCQDGNRDEGTTVLRLLSTDELRGETGVEDDETVGLLGGDS